MIHNNQHTQNVAIEIKKEQLPLHCPINKNELWCSHPRVYLKLDSNNTARCPYCGTQFVVK